MSKCPVMRFYRTKLRINCFQKEVNVLTQVNKKSHTCESENLLYFPNAEKVQIAFSFSKNNAIRHEMVFLKLMMYNL